MKPIGLGNTGIQLGMLKVSPDTTISIIGKLMWILENYGGQQLWDYLVYLSIFEPVVIKHFHKDNVNFATFWNVQSLHVNGANHNTYNDICNLVACLLEQIILGQNRII